MIKKFADGGYNDAGITGGYTGDGSRYQMKGLFSNGNVFDAGEYIVPKPMMMNEPAAVPLIRQLEAIRNEKYSTRNPLPKRFADGGYNGDNNADFSYDGELNNTLKQLNEVLNYLKQNGVEMNYRTFETSTGKVNKVKNIASR